MKKIVLILLSISMGIVVTFTSLNKENIYAKENRLVYVFQVAAFNSYDNASNYLNTLPNGIIVNDSNLYKIYIGIYKDIDLVNKMLVYFEDNNIHVYIKNLYVNKEFYNILDNYEAILNNTVDSLVYDKINQSILNLYLESV